MVYYVHALRKDDGEHHQTVNFFYCQDESWSFRTFPGNYQNLQVNEPLLPQSPGRRKSEKPKNSSKPVLFLMEPTGGSESSYVVHGEKSHIDGKASAYIKKVHQKNLSDLSESPNLPPYILPPPPRAVV
ncbi:hypothetical protein Dsin_032653 [Dipteronia sinensis]|uniref:Uncharacterized protein n=1 Tax=Dipteronia sinensis TaxID=43782 RepID=A0AAD9Z618_9ROSI|nr:hypothetical protein Dsin_032653 [Dipteronia sinensis]